MGVTSLQEALGGKMPGGGSQELTVWFELFRMTLAGREVTIQDLFDAQPGAHSGHLNRALKKLRGRGLVSFPGLPKQGIGAQNGLKIPVPTGTSPNHKSPVRSSQGQLVKLEYYQELLDYLFREDTSKPQQNAVLGTKSDIVNNGTYTLRRIKTKSVFGKESDLIQIQKGGVQPDCASSPQKVDSSPPNAPGSSGSGPVLSAWFSEKDYKRLERKRSVNANDLDRIMRLEQAVFNTSYPGYYREWGSDPFVRTICFADAYAEAWQEYMPGVPAKGPGRILGERYTDSNHWASLVEARRQADRHCARYDEWCRAIFRHYQNTSLPHNALPTPKYFKTPKAAEIYLGWYTDHYHARIREAQFRVWPPEEHDLTCPVQLTAYQRMFEEAEQVGRQDRRSLASVLAVLVEGGVMPQGWLDKHKRNLAPEVARQAEAQAKVKAHHAAMGY